MCAVEHVHEHPSCVAADPIEQAWVVRIDVAAFAYLARLVLETRDESLEEERAELLPDGTSGCIGFLAERETHLADTERPRSSPGPSVCRAGRSSPDACRVAMQKGIERIRSQRRTG